MDNFMISTTGSYEVMMNLFNAIASIFQSHNRGFVVTMVKLSTTVAILSTVMYSLFANHLKPLGLWFVSYMVILNGLLLPVSRVTVKDTMTGQFGTVNNVPFGLAVVASGFNQFSHAFTSIIEQAFQATPGAELEVKEAAVSRLSYLQTGFIFGAHALLQMRGLQITNADFADNMKEFVQQCVVIDCLIGRKYTLHDLKNSPNIWELVSQRPSKIRGFSWRSVERTAGGALARASDSQIITCAEGVTHINELWKKSIPSTGTDIVGGLKQAFGLKRSKVDEEKISAQMRRYVPFALSHLMGVSHNASETLKQQLMIDTIVDATERKAVELGAAPNFEARRAYLLQRTQNETTGHVIAMTLPFFKTVLEALMYALFLFVFPLSLLPRGWQMICIWAKGCLWVNLWPPLFAILNFFVTEGLRLKVAGQIGAAEGLSIANSVGVYNAASDMASIAGWLSASIPLISWWIVDRSAYSLVNMAGSMLSTSQSAVGIAAQESFTGNYTYGNINLDNTQGSQTNLFKHDTSPSYSAGHFMTNDGASSIVTGLNGEQILNVARSTIPVEIDSASYQESQIRDAYNSEMGIYTSKSEQASTQQTKAAGEFLEIGKQSSQLVSSGQHFSNQETASVMEEAASVYSKVHSIAKDSGLNESLVSQLTSKASAGISIGVSAFGIGVGGEVSMESSDSSQATLQKAVNEINQLGQSKEFKESMQHMQQAIQAKSLDIQDQDMQHKAHSMNKHLEKAQSHQQEASKAFSRAQNLSHSAEKIRGDSHRINLVETQEFIKYAAETLGGIEAVEKMALDNPHHLKALGDQYLREKYDSQTSPTPGTPIPNTPSQGHNHKSSSPSIAHEVENEHLNAAKTFRKDKLYFEGNEVPVNLSSVRELGSKNSLSLQTNADPSLQHEVLTKSTLQEQNQQVGKAPEDSGLTKALDIGVTEEQQQNIQQAVSKAHPQAEEIPVGEQTQQSKALSPNWEESGLQPKASYSEPDFEQEFTDSVLHIQQEIISKPESTSLTHKPQAAVATEPEIIFEDSFDEKADPRIQPPPLNKPSIVGQVEQMIALTKQSTGASGDHLRNETKAKQQQFDNQLTTFGQEKLEFSEGSLFDRKLQKLLKDKEKQ